MNTHEAPETTESTNQRDFVLKSTAIVAAGLVASSCSSSKPPAAAEAAPVAAGPQRNPLRVYLPAFACECLVEYLDGRTLGANGGGDRIVLEEADEKGKPGKITFLLSAAKKDFAWKGVVLFQKDATNGWSEIVGGDGGELPKKGTVDWSDFEDSYLVLSKTGAVGQHINVYHLTDAHAKLQPGKQYNIKWLRE